MNLDYDTSSFLESDTLHLIQLVTLQLLAGKNLFPERFPKSYSGLENQSRKAKKGNCTSNAEISN
jgi:hypothetical protein